MVAQVMPIYSSALISSLVCFSQAQVNAESLICLTAEVHSTQPLQQPSVTQVQLRHCLKECLLQDQTISFTSPEEFGCTLCLNSEGHH